jgi:hypothetical protein
MASIWLEGIKKLKKRIVNNENVKYRKRTRYA